jgi:hypothetical protein
MTNGREYIYRFRVFPQHVNNEGGDVIGNLEDDLIDFFSHYNNPY